MAEKELAGLVTMIARHGKVVGEKSYGQQDLATGKPMQKDAIFRIYSMTKPITGVAMMILFEEGKWKPQRSDPRNYIPKFADSKYYAGAEYRGAVRTPRRQRARRRLAS